MKHLKFRQNDKDYVYEIISYMVWEEKKIITILMEEYGDNLFKWIKNNRTSAGQYKTDIEITTDDEKNTFQNCTLVDISFSSTLNAYTINLRYGQE